MRQHIARRRVNQHGWRAMCGRLATGEEHTAADLDVYEWRNTCAECVAALAYESDQHEGRVWARRPPERAEAWAVIIPAEATP